MLQSFQQLSWFCVLMLGPVPLSVKLASHFKSYQSFERILERALVFLVTWIFLQIFTAIFLGALGFFYLKNLGVVEIIMALVGIFYYQRSLKIADLNAIHNENNILISISKFGILFGFFFLLIFTSVFWNQLTWPPVETDSLGYHLPSSIKLIQSGKITFLEHFWFQEHFPRNWEMLGALFLLPFHNDFMVLFPNILAWIIFGISSVLIAKSMGVSNTIGTAWIFLIMLSPLILTHLQTANVDLPFAAFFLSAFYFIIKLRDHQNYLILLVILMSFSLFMGIKSTGLLYAFFLFVLLLLTQFILNKQPQANFFLVRIKVLPIVLLLVISAFGFFWYGYNFYHYKNPLVGIKVKVGNELLLPGIYTSDQISTSSLAQVFNFSNNHDYKTLTKELFNNFSILPFFSIFLVLILFFKSKQKFRTTCFTSNKFVILIMFFITLTIYLKTPFSGNYNGNRDGLTYFVGQGFRFGFPCIALLGILGAAGIEKLKLSNRSLLILFLSSFLYLLFTQKKLIWLCLLIAILVFFFNGDSINRVLAKINFVRNKLTIIILVSFFVVSTILIIPIQKVRSQNKLKRSYGLSSEFIDQKLLNREIIGFPVADQAYTLFGSNFSHEVIYVPFDSLSFQNWIQKLRSMEVKVVAIGPSPSRRSFEKILSQIENSPSQFTRIYGQNPIDDVVLFQFHK